jgi:hypothetical protein
VLTAWRNPWHCDFVSVRGGNRFVTKRPLPHRSLAVTFHDHISGDFSARRYATQALQPRRAIPTR